MNFNILIAGVGGQGTILAARILSHAALKKKLFVRTSETIGMAQRGGSVVSHIRIGGENASSMIPLEHADLIIGFEPAEAVRCLSRLKPDGKCIVSSHPVVPVSASLTASGYAYAEIIDFLKQNGHATVIDAYQTANECGSSKVLNIILLGAACALEAYPFSAGDIEAAVRECVPEKSLDLNIKALHAGERLIEDWRKQQ